MTKHCLQGNLHIVSLGCPKNQVDSEFIAADLKRAGLEIVPQAERANYILINTCGFIESAIREAIDAILSAAEQRGNGNLRNIIVCGCVAQRFTEEIAENLPEVDAIVGTKSYHQIVEVIERLDAAREEDAHELMFVSPTSPEAMRPDGRRELESLKSRGRSPLIFKSWERADAISHMSGERLVSTKSFAYLKIAEGCAHRCAYCAIPGIRGVHISRPMEDILREAENLLDQGVREIILVAQDLSYYGKDLYGRRRLNDLISALLEDQRLKWLRCLYLYPEAINEGFLDLMSKDSRFCPYVDLPVQHASDAVLKRMRRRENGAELRAIIQRLRERVPDISIRTTVMLGFPGETDEDFECLMDFVRDMRFDHLGAFVFSPEEGTDAATMENQVDTEIAKKRYNELMQTQQAISRENLSRWVGRTLEVLVEDVSDDGLFYIGRASIQAPEIDSKIYLLAQREDVQLSSFYEARILESDEYSLTGVIVDEHSEQTDCN
ncbi:MAG: 30S ribosomal protein S12 methylthiotransferase RimO [Eubacteriales bacterium]|nr:30S ribosomal protein S12 methylthiotransferase RimO [Eubacteriales bacterium]